MSAHTCLVVTDKATGQHHAACTTCPWTSQPFLPAFKDAARRSGRFHRTFATTRDQVAQAVKAA